MSDAADAVGRMRDYLRTMADELNELAQFDTMEMYRSLSQLGNQMPAFPDADKVPANFVQGCVSNVYIGAELAAGRVSYRGASESHVVRGYVAILVNALSGLTPAQIRDDSRAAVEEFAETTDIRATLTPNRANAFGNIYALMRDKAAALET